MRLHIQQLLLQRGLAQCEKEAAVLMMSGRVYVSGQRARAGQMVPEDAPVQVKDLQGRFKSKGGLKLEGALEAFGISPSGAVCIDAGASTGGFTDCLIKAGAKLVYAVDVGFGQLMGSLRQNPRVVNLERTNIGVASLLALQPRPVLGTCDLSYLSLTGAVPQFSAILHNEGQLVCLVKPLFETPDMTARRLGVLEDSAYTPLLSTLAQTLSALPGCRVVDVSHSPVRGNHGTLEFFFHVLLGQTGRAPDVSDAIQRSVIRALALPGYRKDAAGDTTREGQHDV